MGTLLVVCAGLKLPQELAGAHVQSTPAWVGSKATTAVIGVLTSTNKNGGGCGSKETEICGGVIPMLAESKAKESLTEVAVTVTEPPLGTEDGAV